MNGLMRMLLAAKVLERLEVDDVETFLHCCFLHLFLILGFKRCLQCDTVKSHVSL